MSDPPWMIKGKTFPFLPLQNDTSNHRCLNIRGLCSLWRPACLLDNPRSHNINEMVATETNLNRPQALSTLLNDYEKAMSYSLAEGTEESWSCFAKACLADMDHLCGPRWWAGRSESDIHEKGFRLIGIYAPSCNNRFSDFFRSLERFLVTSKTIFMLGYLNIVLDEPFGSWAIASEAGDCG